MKINAIGCSLVDNLYSPVDFNSSGYRKWSAESGLRNGLITGGLVFGDDLEISSGKPYNLILNEITGGLQPKQNIGGPAIVAVIHMAQVLDTAKHKLGFYGSMGDDQAGKFISEKLKLFNIETTGYLTSRGKTPFTDVISDPGFHDNNGERTFVNYIGAAGELTGKEIPDAFFDADMLIFGGTGLTPKIHDDLSFLLKKAKSEAKSRAKNIITCVNTVYDFRNQKLNPDKRWPLVEKDEDFNLIDILIADNEEALKISGCGDKIAAADFFMQAGVGSVIITHGADDIVCCSNGSLFKETARITMPVSAEAGRAMKQSSPEEADTTGCGDNFAGGVYASLVEQLSCIAPPRETNELPSLKAAVSFGAVSGGLAGLYKGGVFYEEVPGEKQKKLKLLSSAYEQQIAKTSGVEK